MLWQAGRIRRRFSCLYNREFAHLISGALLQQAEIGIIGGSGLYTMPGFSDIHEVSLETPFGAPSDAYVLGTLADRKVAFLSRHGRGHRFMPTEINYRANIHGFKQLGVERVLSLSAVGSLKEEHHPLDFVIPDQFVDRTRHRVDTFFGDGLVVHIGFGEPICAEVAKLRSTPAGAPASTSNPAAPISTWKARSSRPRPNPISIAAGASTSSA